MMVRNTVIVVAAMAAAITPATAKKTPFYHAYGPQPSWDEYREIGETYIRDRMIDPESARITWLGKFYKGEHKPFLEPRFAGYVACGTVNAKNRLGGYTGSSAFIVVVDYGRVVFGQIDQSTTGLVGAACYEYAKQMKFEPLAAKDKGSVTSSAAPAAAPAAKIASTASGLSLRAMPEGAYVSGVAAGSSAAVAGLTPGMVVNAVNAIPLSGMGDAMLKVIEAAGPNATLAIVGGRTIKLGALK